MSGVSLLKRLGKWSLLKGKIILCTPSLLHSDPSLLTLGALGQEKDWNQLRKQVYDNMSAYLARKEDRIRSKGVEVVTELSEPDLFSEPPDKKVRIDNE